MKILNKIKKILGYKACHKCGKMFRGTFGVGIAGSENFELCEGCTNQLTRNILSKKYFDLENWLKK